jgi:hypothetical protein
MMQDPKKKEVGEMGKPSLKAKFEAAMQKKFDSDNKKKAPEYKSSMLENKNEYIGSVLTKLPSKIVKVPVKKKISKLSAMMSKKNRLPDF